MRKTTTYHCKRFTEAQDRANLYYISAPNATKIVRTIENAIEVRTKTDKVLAAFVW